MEIRVLAIAQNSFVWKTVTQNPIAENGWTITDGLQASSGSHWLNQTYKLQQNGIQLVAIFDGVLQNSCNGKTIFWKSKTLVKRHKYFV